MKMDVEIETVVKKDSVLAEFFTVGDEVALYFTAVQWRREAIETDRGIQWTTTIDGVKYVTIYKKWEDDEENRFDLSVRIGRNEDELIAEFETQILEQIRENR